MWARTKVWIKLFHGYSIYMHVSTSLFTPKLSIILTIDCDATMENMHYGDMFDQLKNDFQRNNGELLSRLFDNE